MFHNNSLEWFKIVIAFIFIVWLTRVLFTSTGILKETFAPYPNSFKANPYPKNLHDILTKDCKVEYCNAHNWYPGESPNIPKGYDVTNIYTKQGCCIVPNELKTLMHESRGNNHMHF